MMTSSQQKTCDSYRFRAHLGDFVCAKDDPTQVGRIERIMWSCSARVRWENGFVTDTIPLDNLWPIVAQEWV